MALLRPDETAGSSLPTPLVRRVIELRSPILHVFPKLEVYLPKFEADENRSCSLRGFFSSRFLNFFAAPLYSFFCLTEQQQPETIISGRVSHSLVNVHLPRERYRFFFTNVFEAEWIHWKQEVIELSRNDAWDFKKLLERWPMSNTLDAV